MSCLIDPEDERPARRRHFHAKAHRGRRAFRRPAAGRRRPAANAETSPPDSEQQLQLNRLPAQPAADHVVQQLVARQVRQLQFRRRGPHDDLPIDVLRLRVLDLCLQLPAVALHRRLISHQRQLVRPLKRHRRRPLLAHRLPLLPKRQPHDRLVLIRLRLAVGRQELRQDFIRRPIGRRLRRLALPPAAATRPDDAGAFDSRWFRQRLRRGTCAQVSNEIDHHPQPHVHLRSLDVSPRSTALDCGSPRSFQKDEPRDRRTVSASQSLRPERPTFDAQGRSPGP